jgi:hypothetical protein
MALDAAHRASIYEKLRPILGDEDANALMSEFPAVEAHELVTKDFLRAELSELRSDLRAELHAQISGVRGEISGVRGEISGVREEISGVRGEISGVREEICSVRGEIAEVRSWMLLRLGSAIAAATAIQVAALGLLT